MVHERLERVPFALGQIEHGGQDGQFVVIYLEYVGQFQGGGDDRPRVELLAQVDVAYLECVGGGAEKVMDGGAGDFGPLGQGAETDRVRLGGQTARVFHQG